MSHSKNLPLTKWGMIFFIILIPFNFALNPSSGIDLAVVRVVIPIIFLIWLLESLWRKSLILDTRLRAWLLIFILGFSICSLLWATNSTKAGRKILFLGSILPIYWVFFVFLKNKLNFKLFLKIFFGTALVSALIGLLQFLSQFLFGIDFVIKAQSEITPFFLGKNFSETVLTYNSWLVNVSGKTLFRAIGLFPDPHLFSLFLNISLPVGWFLFLKEKKSFYLIGFFLILIVSLLTFSRAGYLSLLVVFLVGWLKFLRIKNSSSSHQKSTVVKNVLLALLVFGFVIIPNPINQRFYSTLNFQDGSVNERLMLWKTGLEVTRDNFWGGVGIGNLSETIQPLSDQRIPIYAHNLFLDFSSELGFFGGLAILIIIISPIINYFKTPSRKTFLVMLIFTIILIQSLFETPFYSVQLLPLILAFLAIL